jgi:polyhydroxybutyrate depolymerase
MKSAIVASVLIAAASACNTLNTGENVFQVNGRTVRAYVPSGMNNSSRPAIFNFHGYGGSGAGMASTLNGVAEDETWVHVYPDGSGLVRGWNGLGCCPGVIADDVQHFQNMLAELESRTCIDTSNVYATGFSNGGFMAYRLMCELGDVIKGVGPVAGTLGSTGREQCNNVGSGTTVVHTHGTSDGTISYNPSALSSGAQQSVNRAAQLYGCESSAVSVRNVGRTECERYNGCNGGVSVELCTIEGYGHSWPRDNSGLGLDAGEYMVSVFKENM